jgi:hypothetical protein
MILQIWIVIFDLIIFCIVKEQLKLEKEEIRLNLRKNKINNILFSKRKINYMNEINDDIKYHYCININDFNIPQELNINISKFNKDVSMKFIIFYYFLSSSILLY